MQLHAVCVPLSNIMVRFVHQKSEAAKKMRMRKWGKARRRCMVARPRSSFASFSASLLQGRAT